MMEVRVTNTWNRCRVYNPSLLINSLKIAPWCWNMQELPNMKCVLQSALFCITISPFCWFKIWKSYMLFHRLTLILLMWRIRWAPNNARRWQMGFSLVFIGLTLHTYTHTHTHTQDRQTWSSLCTITVYKHKQILWLWTDNCVFMQATWWKTLHLPASCTLGRSLLLHVSASEHIPYTPPCAEGSLVVRWISQASWSY